jgi:hypothetical protein
MVGLLVMLTPFGKLSLDNRKVWFILDVGGTL